MVSGFFLYPEKLPVQNAGPSPKLKARRGMLAGGGRINQQRGRHIFFKRNTAKKFFLNFYFYNGFIFVKKYFEKIRKVFLFCEKLFLKKFFPGKVFDAKFSGKSFFAEKIFAESCRKKFWKKKFPQHWPKKFLPGKSLAWGKFLTRSFPGKVFLRKKYLRKVAEKSFGKKSFRNVGRKKIFAGKVFPWQRV